MNQIRIIALCAGLLMLAAGQQAWAQETAAPANRAGHFAFGFGFGPMLSTESGSILGLEFTGDYFVSHELSVGPLLQVGLDDGYSQVGLTAQIKYTFDIDANPMIHPHVQGGMGFIHASNGGSQTDFLLPLGGGIDVEVAKHLFLNTTLLLNVTGLRDDLYVSWFFGFRVEI
jgi:hypothetical protein